MLASLAVRGFQSLRDVSLELGRFTVIVGPSSSGKSALMRALKVLASNSRGTPYISHGSKSSAVTARLEEGPVITLERGGSQDGYKVTAGGEDFVFTKLGGAVPEEVTRVLRIDPVKDGQSINFAGQFDRPYLLDSSGGEIARKLGELTNVSVIFEASREANRRRLDASKKLKTRQEDLQLLVEQAQTFRTLPARVQACAEAERAVAEAQRVESQIATVRGLLSQWEVAHGALERARVAAQVTVPDFEPIAQAQARISELRQLFAQLQTARQNAERARAQREQCAAQVADLEQRLHAVLEEAGECPVCGQSTKELSVA